MKKALISVALIFLVATGTFAQAAGSVHMDKGDLAVNAGINVLGLGIGGGAEMMLARWDIANVIPLTFGVAGKAGIGLLSGFNLTVAALGTAHFGLATFTDLPEWLQKFDWNTGLGLGIGIGKTFGIGIAYGGGISYYLKPELAIHTEWISVSNATGIANVGVLLKL
jgi:hypothetical protein